MLGGSDCESDGLVSLNREDKPFISWLANSRSNLASKTDIRDWRFGAFLRTRVRSAVQVQVAPERVHFLQLADSAGPGSHLTFSCRQGLHECCPRLRGDSNCASAISSEGYWLALDGVSENGRQHSKERNTSNAAMTKPLQVRK
jgi:hypothetical protein